MYQVLYWACLYLWSLLTFIQTMGAHALLHWIFPRYFPAQFSTPCLPFQRCGTGSSSGPSSPLCSSMVLPECWCLWCCRGIGKGESSPSSPSASGFWLPWLERWSLVQPWPAFTEWPGRTWPPWKPWCGALDRQYWRSSSPSQGSSPHSEVSVRMSLLHIRKQTYRFSENGVVSEWAWDRTRTYVEGAGRNPRPWAVWEDRPLVFNDCTTAPHLTCLRPGQGAPLRDATRKSTLFSCQSG